MNLRVVLACSVTACASLSALSAIWVTGMTGDRLGAYFLMLAGICDALDGVVARKLGATSAFGAAYDSLSDLLAFGVAPAACLVLLGLCHPVAAAAYVMAIQFRLARFNAQGDLGSRFYQGIASPDAAYALLLIGMIPGVGYTLGALGAGALAVWPGRLGPKGWRVLRGAVGLAAVVLFVHTGV